MNIIDCTQGEAEWLQARMGRVTASRVVDAVSFLKRGDKQGQESAARAAYKAELVSEILSGSCADHYVSSYMERGTEMEPEARAFYELRQNVLVEAVGFVIHPVIERAGASPDGLVGEDGGLEIKCPKTETHLAYMLAGKLPLEYEPQVMWSMACTGREWWDFASYDDRLPERHRVFIIRVYRDDQRIAELEAGVVMFLKEVDEMIARLNELNPETEQFKKALRESLDAEELGITDDDIKDWYRGQGMEAPAQFK